MLNSNIDIIIFVLLFLIAFALIVQPSYIATDNESFSDTHTNDLHADKDSSTNMRATDARRFKYTRPSIVKQLYKLMYIIDHVFVKNDIEYWMDGGTFLGAVRHQGIIPWDDDGDIQIWHKDIKKFRALQSEFLQHNIVMMDTWFGFKLFFKDAKQIKGYKWSYPAIDVFPMKITDDHQVVYSYPRAFKSFGKCTYELKYLYPLKRYKFGTFEMFGASELAINPYFNKCYGTDWSTHAYQMFDHENEKPLKRVKVVLTDDERLPALPIEFDKNL